MLAATIFWPQYSVLSLYAFNTEWFGRMLASLRKDIPVLVGRQDGKPIWNISLRGNSRSQLTTIFPGTNGCNRYQRQAIEVQAIATQTTEEMNAVVWPLRTESWPMKRPAMTVDVGKHEQIDRARWKPSVRCSGQLPAGIQR